MSSYAHNCSTLIENEVFFQKKSYNICCKVSLEKFLSFVSGLEYLVWLPKMTNDLSFWAEKNKIFHCIMAFFRPLVLLFITLLAQLQSEYVIMTEEIDLSRPDLQSTIDEIVEPSLTVKVIGHQWYWSYEYSTDLTVDGEQLIDADETFLFDSYLKDESDLEIGELRLLEVDNRVVVPADTTIRLLMTAEDVLHNWAMPSFGIKMDTVPGRINETWFRVSKEKIGVYRGQCSELCGVRHGFMPIVVEVVSKKDYARWLVKAKNEFANTVEPTTVAQKQAAIR